MTQICKVFTVGCPLVVHGHRIVWKCLSYDVVLLLNNKRVQTSILRKASDRPLMITTVLAAENIS